MFYTPNKQNYISELKLQPANAQQCEVQFDLNYLVAYELTKSVKDYSPLIISMNYTEDNAAFAMISYGVFTKNGSGEISGARILRQVAIINGFPFELKSIYGMESEQEAVVGEEDHPKIEEGDDQSKECLICLCETKDTLIMPCGHYCICGDCGRALIKAKQTCPICRGNIGSLIPMKKA